MPQAALIWKDMSGNRYSKSSTGWTFPDGNASAVHLEYKEQVSEKVGACKGRIDVQFVTPDGQKH